MIIQSFAHLATPPRLKLHRNNFTTFFISLKEMPQLVGKEVGEVGFGLMGMNFTCTNSSMCVVVTKHHRYDMAPKPTPS
jgi:hypothetical protein